MVWMITLHKQFVKSFLEGEKDIELRTRIPKNLMAGDDIVVAQSGSRNKVIFHMKVYRVLKLSPNEMFSRFHRNIQLNYLAYEEYTKNREWVYGIQCREIVPLKKEVYTSDFEIEKAPQWFRRVTKECLSRIKDLEE